MDQKKVACPAIIQNTAFSIVIKGFEPLDNGRGKTEGNKGFFFIKDHSNVTKAFSKSRKSNSPGIFFNSGVINNAVN